MSDLTDKMVDAAWGAYSDEVAESGVPSTQVKVAVAAALRVLAYEGYSLAYRLPPSGRANIGHLTFPNALMLADEIESSP